MKNDKQFVKSLEYHIRKREAIDKIISDSEKSEISLRAKDMLRALFVDEWKSEVHNQHQNFAGRRCQTIKRHTKTLLDRTRDPACTWLLSMMHFFFFLNHFCNACMFFINWRKKWNDIGISSQVQNRSVYTKPKYFDYFEIVLVTNWKTPKQRMNILQLTFKSNYSTYSVLNRMNKLIMYFWFIFFQYLSHISHHYARFHSFETAHRDLLVSN